MKVHFFVVIALIAGFIYFALPVPDRIDASSGNTSRLANSSVAVKVEPSVDLPLSASAKALVIPASSELQLLDGWMLPVQIASGGSLPAITVDHNRVVHVVWEGGGGAKDIFYSTNLSGTWSTPLNLSDNPNADSGSPAIGSGTDNILHVVWAEGSDTAPMTGTIEYRNLTPDVGWSIPITISDALYRPGAPSVVLDDGNNAHVAFLSNWSTSGAHVQYRKRTNAGNWGSIEQVSTSPNWNALPSITVDSLGQPHVAWWGNPLLKYAYRLSSGNWSVERTIDSLGLAPSLAMGAVNSVYALGAVYSSGVYLCEKQLNGSWSCLQVPGSSYPSSLSGRALAVDNQNQTYAVWAGYVSGDSYPQVILASRTSGGEWLQPVAITHGAITAYKPSITIDPNGHLHVVYYDSQGRIFYITNTPVQTYSISGQITDSNNNPISGVTISDGAGHTTTTDSSGNYTLSGLAVGAYTITPFKSGCTFNPPNRIYIYVQSNQAAQDYMATVRWTHSSRHQKYYS